MLISHHVCKTQLISYLSDKLLLAVFLFYQLSPVGKCLHLWHPSRWQRCEFCLWVMELLHNQDYQNIKLKKIKAKWIKRFIKVTKSLDNVAVYRIFFMNVINQHIKCTNIFFIDILMSISIMRMHFCNPIISTTCFVIMELGNFQNIK